MTPRPPFENTLYYGDNLDILREYIPDECIDLIYLDPPFNSSRNYNVLFKDERGKESEAQIMAFEDTWHWTAATEQAFRYLVAEGPGEVGEMIAAMRRFIGTNQMMAYLVMMAVRLVEMHRVLKPTGSLYLHCDPTASHYLKIVLDTIFGPERFRDEIIWKRSAAHNDVRQGAKQPGRIHDVLLFYTKSDDWTWNPVYAPYSPDYIRSSYALLEKETGRFFKSTDLTAAKPGGDTSYEWKGRKPHNGRYWAYSKENMERFEREGRIYYTSTGLPRLKQYLDEMPGIHIQNIWDDIPPIGAQAAERMGWPTQKPLALLERIIKASSNPGDWVLDSFAGCGTTVIAAQGLGRHWIGIDISSMATAMNEYRLKAMYPDSQYKVVGLPVDPQGALALAQQDRYQFQWWALSLVKARPVGGEPGSKKGKKGKDMGIDGVITFMDDASNKLKRAVVQVKSGHVKSGDVRDLRGVLDREEAEIGVFITYEHPSRDMVQEAVTAGAYHSQHWQRDYPRIQILTIEELLNGAEIRMPAPYGTFKEVPRADQDNSDQPSLF